MDPNQLTTILVNAQSPDPALRGASEKWLAEADKQNPALFLQMLCAELSSDDKPVQTRTLAGLILKNALSAKEEARKLQLIQKWLSLDANVKGQVKQTIAKTLGSAVADARHTAAQVIARIAHIEIPRNLWPELVPQLLVNMQQNDDNIKQATLQTLGYIAEEIEPEVLSLQANEILTQSAKELRIITMKSN